MKADCYLRSCAEAFGFGAVRLRDISSIQAPTSSDRQRLFFATCIGPGNLPSLTQSVPLETGAIFWTSLVLNSVQVIALPVMLVPLRPIRGRMRDDGCS